MDAEQNSSGIQFTPPEGTVEPDAREGEGMVKWVKSGDGYIITEFEGKPIASAGDASEMPADQELDQMATS
jgi:hypothetical protein